MVGTIDGGESPPVAVLGTGIMGAAMARRLLAANLRTTVWDRSPAVTTPLREAGAEVASTPNDAVKDAAVVITMLPTADVVNDVVFDGKVTDAFRHGAVWAQMGTIGPDATLELAGRLRSLRPDVMLVDAPVSGSKDPAEAGQLLVLASGPTEAQAILEPAFAAIGRETVWLGDAGQEAA
jgi:3-hydroxyisobutyrate dehydrogenase